MAQLADAVAGSIGSCLATVVFYPIDIAKTRVQVEIIAVRSEWQRLLLALPVWLIFQTLHVIISGMFSSWQADSKQACFTSAMEQNTSGPSSSC
jgi:Mitochondrial carrier protein